jgi:kinesin family protein 2/24
MYESLVQPLVASVFAGTKVSCFAYGQTGSGKTYTMMGDVDKSIPGLYLLAAQDVFTLLELPENSHLQVGVSFYEIYCGKSRDLLNDSNICPIRVDAKDNVNIVGLTEKYIENVDSLMSLIRHGLSVRVTGQTGANDQSSRSHAVLQISLRTQKNKIKGKLSFIDLAGSERGADVTNTVKQTRFDGAEINKSLLALKECIRALDLAKRHLPFRGSKLTLVLKDSFIGKCKTVMIGNISPGKLSCEHSLNTLR